jgi:hypothetical protein
MVIESVPSTHHIQRDKKFAFHPAHLISWGSQMRDRIHRLSTVVDARCSRSHPHWQYLGIGRLLMSVDRLDLRQPLKIMHSDGH